MEAQQDEGDDQAVHQMRSYVLAVWKSEITLAAMHASLHVDDQDIMGEWLLDNTIATLQPFAQVIAHGMPLSISLSTTVSHDHADHCLH